MLNQWTHRLYHVVALGALFCTAAFSQANNLLVSSSTLSFSALSGDTLPQQQFLAVSSATGSLPVTAAVRYFSATEGWLSVSPSTGSTPLTLTVTVNPTGIPAGAYLAQVTLIAGATQSTLVNVNLTVSGSTTSGGLLSVSPASLNLSSDLGVTAQSTVTISSGNATPFNVAISTSNGGNWLTTGASFATAPTSLTILANPVGLLAGIYSGNVTLIPSLGGTSLSIPVSFTVGTLTTSGLTVSPSTVNFSYQTGTAFPSAQPVLISYSSAIVSYLATASNSWIKLTSNQTNTPAQTVAGSSNTYLNVSADPTGLSPGFYSASIAIAASNLTVQTITVTLTVSNTALFNATPSSLSFNFLPGGVLPPSQQVTVSTTGSPLAFTVSSVSSGWLVAGPQNGQTNGQNVVTVSVNPGGLATGTYTGSVSVTSGSTSFSIPVTLTVGTAGFFRISGQSKLSIVPVSSRSPEPISIAYNFQPVADQFLCNSHQFWRELVAGESW